MLDLALTLRLVLALGPAPEPPHAEAELEAPAASEGDASGGGLPGDWFYPPSVHLDMGPIVHLDRPAQTNFSMLIDAGAALVYRPAYGVVGMVLRPALGYRFDKIPGGRHLGELGLELGADFDGFFYLGYRPALVAGSTPDLVAGRSPVLGLRHGPVLGTLWGVFSISLSHQYLALPQPSHDLRIGIALELDVFMWMLAMFAVSDATE